MQLLQEVIELDLRNLVEAEEALKSDKLHDLLRYRKYRALFESSPEATLLFDSVGFVDCNTSALKLFRLNSKSEMMGMDLTAFMPKEQPDGRNSAEQLSEARKSASRNGQSFGPMTLQINDGTDFVADVGIAVIISWT